MRDKIEYEDEEKRKGAHGCASHQLYRGPAVGGMVMTLEHIRGIFEGAEEGVWLDWF